MLGGSCAAAMRSAWEPLIVSAAIVLGTRRLGSIKIPENFPGSFLHRFAIGPRLRRGVLLRHWATPGRVIARMPARSESLQEFRTQFTTDRNTGDWRPYGFVPRRCSERRGHIRGWSNGSSPTS